MSLTTDPATDHPVDDDPVAAHRSPGHEPRDHESAGHGFSGLLWDVGAPLVGYYGLHALGASDWVALTAATVAAGLRLVWVAVRQRRVTWFAAVMLAVFGLGLVVAFVAGDPRVLLLKHSLASAGIGAVFLLSLLSRSPLTLSALRTWQPSEGAEMARLYATSPGVRRVFRLSSVVWGLGLLAEAAIRVPLVYLLPVPVAVGVSTGLTVVTVGGLAAWNVVYGNRARRRLEAAETERDA